MVEFCYVDLYSMVLCPFRIRFMYKTVLSTSHPPTTTGLKSKDEHRWIFFSLRDPSLLY